MEMITDFFNNAFAAIDSPDSIAFLTFIAGFFLLGFLIAALLYGSRARRYRRELKQLKKDYKDLQIEHERLQEQIDLKQADLIRAEREAEEATIRVRNIEREKESLNVEVMTLTNENAKLTQLTKTYANNIEALNNQIIGLNTRNNQLANTAEQEGEAMNQLMDMQSSYKVTIDRLAALESKLDTYGGENEVLRKKLEDIRTNTEHLSLTDLEVKVDKLAKENQALQSGLADINVNTDHLSLTDLEVKFDNLVKKNEALQSALEEIKTKATTASIAELEAKIRNILDDNAALRKELESVKASTEALSFAAANMTDVRGIGDIATETATAEDASELNETDKSIKTEAAKNAVKKAIGGKIAVANREEKDDLTVIKGIGNFIEQKLNGLGIYTFQQISQFDNDLVEEVTAAIEFFPGRIERDDWVGQAARLSEIKRTNPAAIEQAVFPNNVEDLTIVEGIGPKLEKLLKGAGIGNWQELAKTDVKKLKDILKAGGKEYQLHDPSTWPMQAQMAADLKWAELKDYQDYLVGGRE